MTSKYEFIDAEKANYPITKMCTWFGVSKSGFYEWRDRPTSATAQRREYLKVLIAKHFELSHQTYGYRRMHAALRRQGEQVSPELVRDLMRELDLVACQPRPFRPTTTTPDPAAPAPDLVDRDFTAAAPGKKFVGDITYIPPGRAGCIWPPPSTATANWWPAGPWPTICDRVWSSPRWTWPPPTSPSHPERFFIVIMPRFSLSRGNPSSFALLDILKISSA